MVFSIHDLKRFLSYTELGELGDLVWTGRRDQNGHGLFRFRGHLIHAHILIAALWGLDARRNIIHLCGNPACVNPAHLSNIPRVKDTDSSDPDGPVRGEAHANSKLTAEEVIDMREDRADGNYTIAELAHKYGCSSSQVQMITTGKSWKHVGGPITKTFRINDEEVVEIRRRYWQGTETQNDLANEFGIRPSYVSLLVRGKRRPNAGGPTSPE